MVVAGAADDGGGSCRRLAGVDLLPLISLYKYGEEEEERVFPVLVRWVYSGLLIEGRGMESSKTDVKAPRNEGNGV